MTNIYKVGIDPGSNKSGVAVLWNGHYSQLLYLDYEELRDFVDRMPDDTEFYVEDPDSMRVVHNRLQTDSKSIAMGQRMARNIGQCQHAATMIINMIKNKNRSVRPIKPQRGISKRTKKDANFFNRLTGWTGTSNEHKRDAAMLIYQFYTSTKINNLREGLIK